MKHPIPDEALDADIAILGKKGRGKTYTAKGIVERLLEMKRRVLVLDPLSTWWGLKSNAAGDGPGFPVAVFGGPHGDMPLTEAVARPLARVVAENNLPAVVDMGEMRKAAWQRLVRDMMDELFTVNRDPLWIVLEEADIFAPQQPREGDSAAVLGEVDRIARRGRAYGFRLITITQRPARLHKDVLTQLSTLVALGMTSPQDRDAIKAWVDGNADRDQSKAVMETLAKLPVGEGWLWAPDHDILERTTFPPIKTLDTSKTPKAGDRRIEPTDLAKVDLSGFVKALHRDDKPAPGPAPKSVDLAAIEAKAFSKGRESGFSAGRDAGYDEAVSDLRAKITTALGQIKPARDAPKPPPAGESGARHENPVPAATSQPHAAPDVDGITPAAHRLLSALAVYPGPIHFKVAAKRAGLSIRSSGLPNYRKRLVGAGFATDTSGMMQVTDLGRSVAGPAPSGIDEWLSSLPRGQANMLRVLRESSEPLYLDEIADASGTSRTSSGLNSGLKQLVDLGLAERVRPGWFRLAQDMR